MLWVRYSYPTYPITTSIEEAMLFNQSITHSLKVTLLTAVVSACLIGCTDKEAAEKEGIMPAAAELTKITGLKTPESVVQAKDGKIYVSEINEFGKDGDGQISLIGNGQATLFADGMDDPKGLIIIGDYLYVADNTKIHKVSLADATQKEVFVPASAFPKTPQFLNDLEADPQGNLYVSDSGDIQGTGKGGAIYKINASGEVTKLVDGTDNPVVMAPNGLLADDTGTFLTFVDFTSGILYNLNTETGEVSDIEEGFGGGDGIVHHSNGTLYVSDWKNGKVFSINVQGDVETVGPQYQAAADIAITKDERYLMVPDMKAGELDFNDLQPIGLAK